MDASTTPRADGLRCAHRLHGKVASDANARTARCTTSVWRSRASTTCMPPTSTATGLAQALPDGVNGSPHTPHGTRTSWTTTGSVRSVAQQRLEEAAMFASV